MAVLAKRSIVKAGLDDAALGAAAAGGDSFPLDGAKKNFFRVKNAHAVNPRTVTIASQLPAGAVPEGAAAANLVVVVPALKDYMVGPVDPIAYRDANGRAVVTYSDAAADLTVGAYDV